jgi:hypothetical protein
MEDDQTGYISSRPPPANSRKAALATPNGRPKGSGNFKTDLLEVLGRTVFITENGERRAVTGRKAVAIWLLHDAVRGDAKALSNLTALLLKHDIDADAKPHAEAVTENDHVIIEDFLRRNSIPISRNEDA